VRIRIVGTRVDQQEIVGVFIFAILVRNFKFLALVIFQFAIGTIKEDYLGPSQN
jgi:hypothetical protein